MYTAFKKQTKKLLYEVDSFKDNGIHNIDEKLKEMTSFNIASLGQSDVGNSETSTSVAHVPSTSAADVPSTSEVDMPSTSAVDEGIQKEFHHRGHLLQI